MGESPGDGRDADRSWPRYVPSDVPWPEPELDEPAAGWAGYQVPPKPVPAKPPVQPTRPAGAAPRRYEVAGRTLVITPRIAKTILWVVGIALFVAVKATDATHTQEATPVEGDHGTVVLPPSSPPALTVDTLRRLDAAVGAEEIVNLSVTPSSMTVTAVEDGLVYTFPFVGGSLGDGEQSSADVGDSFDLSEVDPAAIVAARRAVEAAVGGGEGWNVEVRRRDGAAEPVIVAVAVALPDRQARVVMSADGEVLLRQGF